MINAKLKRDKFYLTNIYMILFLIIFNRFVRISRNFEIVNDSRNKIVLKKKVPQAYPWNLKDEIS
jgi:hypothetical protein